MLATLGNQCAESRPQDSVLTTLYSHDLPNFGDLALYQALYGVDEVQLRERAPFAGPDHLETPRATLLVARDDPGVAPVGPHRRTYLVQRLLNPSLHVAPLCHTSMCRLYTSARNGSIYECPKRFASGPVVEWGRQIQANPHRGRRRMDNDDRTLLVLGAPQHDAAGYHLSGFLAPDPVICLRAAGKKYLAVSALEYGRAEKEAPADELVSFEELDVIRLARELKSGERAFAAATANLLQKIGVDGSPVIVPPHFGVAYADELRARGFKIEPEGRLFADLRRVKTQEEISHIEEAQRALEEACAQAVGILEEAEISGEGTLRWRGENLTSELLRSEIDVELLRRGCAADEGTIAAGGPQADDTNERGSGSLMAGATLILQISPSK